MEETGSVKAWKENACCAHGKAAAGVAAAEGMLGTVIGNEVREEMGTRL